MSGRPARRNAMRRAATAILAVPLLLAAAATGAGYLLPVAPSDAAADALVVLGGFGVPRAELAARLYGLGEGSVVIVSGAGDNAAMRETLIAHGVPERAILAEPFSRTTQENARNVARLLRARGLGSAKLVTHWFHARRALAAFRTAAPEISFSTASVTPSDTPPWLLGWRSEPKAALSEYAKAVWYAVVHRVVPRVGPERPEAAG